MSEVVLEIGAPEAPEVDVDADDLDTYEDVTSDAPAGVTEAMVRGLLAGAGLLAHQLAPEHLGLDLHFQADELDGIVPPLTRIINRRPALVAAVHRGDELTLATYFAGYLGRNISTARRALNEDRERETGGAAPGSRADARGDAGPVRGPVDDAAPGAGFSAPPAR